MGKMKKYDYSRFALKMGTVGSILVVVAMLFYTKVDDSNIPRLTLYVAEFSLLPFLYFIKEWVTANLRWQFKNREYGIVMNVHSVLNASMAILGAYLGESRCDIRNIFCIYWFSCMWTLFSEGFCADWNFNSTFS